MKFFCCFSSPASKFHRKVSLFKRLREFLRNSFHLKKEETIDTQNSINCVKKLTFKKIATIQVNLMAIQIMIKQRRKRFSFRAMSTNIILLGTLSKKIQRKALAKKALRILIKFMGMCSQVRNGKIAPKQKEISEKILTDTKTVANETVDKAKDFVYEDFEKIEKKVKKSNSKDSLKLVQEKSVDIDIDKMVENDEESVQLDEILQTQLIITLKSKISQKRKDQSVEGRKEIESKKRDLKTLEELVVQLKFCRQNIEIELIKLNEKYGKISMQSQVPKFVKTSEFIKAMKYNPPIAIQMVLAGICALTGIEPTYIINGANKNLIALDYLPASRQLLGGDFRKILENFRSNEESMNKGDFEIFQNFILKHPDFDRKKIENSYPICTCLYDWIMKINEFGEILFEIRKKKRDLEILEEAERTAKFSLIVLKRSLKGKY